uniref:actin nucleation-promoting factor WAS n=1 Tax=Nyctereutes procyonoides TaxID=34880 RepID=UPI00244516DB|nr:actin nucleation-promoting factor WAS [Nyctereutes procyonoides]
MRYSTKTRVLQSNSWGNEGVIKSLQVSFLRVGSSRGSRSSRRRARSSPPPPGPGARAGAWAAAPELAAVCARSRTGSRCPLVRGAQGRGGRRPRGQAPGRRSWCSPRPAGVQVRRLRGPSAAPCLGRAGPSAPPRPARERRRRRGPGRGPARPQAPAPRLRANLVAAPGTLAQACGPEVPRRVGGAAADASSYCSFLILGRICLSLERDDPPSADSPRMPPPCWRLSSACGLPGNSTDGRLEPLWILLTPWHLFLHRF